MAIQTHPSTITKFRAGEALVLTDTLAVEEPLGIALLHGPARQRKNLSVTMRTPGQDEELALGFLFTEGIIRRYDEVQELRHDDHHQLTVILREDVSLDLPTLERNFYTSSSCGICSKASVDAVRTLSTFSLPADAPSTWTVTPDWLHQLPERLRQQQALFAQTGGIHAGALFEPGGSLLLLREDVGRHNALDKLVGNALQAGQLPLQNQVLLLSGRASFELIQKAAMAGIRFVAAVGAPSSLAVELAQEMDLTLVGFLREDQFNVYHGLERIQPALTT
ncbi:formate dehydrogenase accessory sulfurtransferase FdhD [Rhabdobacter roseus]|uniref:Sulfur carrier protein FdhD n=1 Tax=Rhabdobacter roseus TaxID=1655419 RepID=A0A840U2T6_9BACT|nr:formate dehydrogenase accessory sulfurtransferase FdhD [Rhabdobacter roseus]MBB5286159.1 FdhD protein [Rhabdobacter roseus]